MKILSKYLLLEKFDVFDNDNINEMMKYFSLSKDDCSKILKICEQYNGTKEELEHLVETLDPNDDYYINNEYEYYKDRKEIDTLYYYLDMYENQMLKLSKKEKIVTLHEFSILYLDKLEKHRGFNKDYDDFINWLHEHRNDIPKSLSENVKRGEYGLLKYFFKEELVTPELLIDFKNNSDSYY